MSDAFEIIQAQTRIPRTKRNEDGFSRMDVVKAFSNAFEMIGGVPRLALWANQHPDKFYPLYAKLMPATSLVINGDNTKLVIEHALPTTELDDYTDVQVKSSHADD